MDTSVQEPPLDYSFRNIHVTQDLLSEEPRTGLRPLRHSRSGKSMTQSLWLNNNVLTDLRDFSHVVSQLLEHPENLAWIDLSFNDLTSIDPHSAPRRGEQAGCPPSAPELDTPWEPHRGREGVQAIRAVHCAPRHHIRLQRGHQSRPRHGPGVEAHARQTEEGPEDRARRTLRLLGPQPSQGPEDVVACDNK